MANLPELNEFTTGIYQIETADPVIGGVDGITNVPLKALANRTKWLKAQVDALNAAIEETIDAAYVTAELNKLAYKAPVRVATTTNITLSGLQTIDGVSVTAGERVLVKNQSTGAQNGIYLAQVSGWVRAADMNDDSEVMPGMAVVVSGGTNQADTIWMLSTDGTVTVGTTAMTFKNAIAGLAPIDSPAFTGNVSVGGSMGFGVAASPWLGAFASLDIKTGGLGIAAGTDYGTIALNAYYSGSTWKYKATSSNSVARYDQFNGKHEFYVAAPGVAGSDISFTKIGEFDGNGSDILGLSKANTAAQFDISRNLASTEFVQRALGNARGFAGFTTNTSLTAAHAGMEIYASSTTGSITLSLPAANALPAGAQYRIFNTGVSDVIVSRVGADTIVVNNTTNTVTAVTLKSGDSIVLTSLGTGNLWYHGGGTAQLGSSGAFGSSRLTNGWQRLPSGLIIQWASGASTTTGDQEQTITFPVSFPGACLHLGVSTRAGSASVSDGWFQERSFTNSNCVVVSQYIGSGNVSGGITPKITAIGY